MKHHATFCTILLKTHKNLPWSNFITVPLPCVVRYYEIEVWHIWPILIVGAADIIIVLVATTTVSVVGNKMESSMKLR